MQTTMTIRFALLVASACLAACSGSGQGLDSGGRPVAPGGAGDGVLTADFASIQSHVFTPICTVCHAGAGAPEGLRLDSVNSYGLLKHLSIRQDGTWIDGSKIGPVTIDDLALDHRSDLRLRFTAPPQAQGRGGLTLYGKGFGNHNQAIVATLIGE